MNPVIKFLVGRWYSPDEQDEREQRTAAAHEHAIQTRVHAEHVDVKVEQLRQSAARAGRRLAQ